jgi:hypothetical protein
LHGDSAKSFVNKNKYKAFGGNDLCEICPLSAVFQKHELRCEIISAKHRLPVSQKAPAMRYVQRENVRADETVWQMWQSGKIQLQHL